MNSRLGSSIYLFIYLFIYYLVLRRLTLRQGVSNCLGTDILARKLKGNQRKIARSLCTRRACANDTIGSFV